jgi:predicted HicB family RNase H-like nuclease
MKIMLKHRGYTGSFTFDEKTNLFHGKAYNTHYPITFQGKSVESTKQAFKDAINDYVAWCNKYGKNKEKSTV